MANWSATEISTVGPSKTYATLAAWWAAKGGHATTAPHAECYGGADLGTVVVSGAGGTPTSSYYVRTYVAPGHRHDGTRNGTAGAYANVPNGGKGIDNRLAYTRIEGIRLIVADGGSSTYGVYNTTDVDGSIVDGVCVTLNATAGAGIKNGVILAGHLQTAPVSDTVQNCVVYGPGGSVNRHYGFMLAAQTVGQASNHAVYNNTVVNLGTYSGTGGAIGFRWYRSAVDRGPLVIDSQNNIATGCYRSFLVATFSATVVQNYCAADDDRADDWETIGGSNLINQTPADLFVNAATDANLKDSNSNAYHAGTDVGLSADAVGNPWANPNPSMGALELLLTGYHFYRGIGGLSNINLDTPVGTACAGQSSKTFTGLGHASNTRYTYLLRPVRHDANSDWLETPDMSCTVELETDDSGNWVGDRPMQVEWLGAEILSGARIRLRWRYRTPYGGAVPADFGIYYGTDRNITPGSPQATESYTRDGEYSRTLSLIDGVAYYFAVTARDVGGVESHVPRIIGPYVARNTAPPQPTVLVEQTF